MTKRYIVIKSPFFFIAILAIASHSPPVEAQLRIPSIPPEVRPFIEFARDVVPPRGRGQRQQRPQPVPENAPIQSDAQPLEAIAGEWQIPVRETGETSNTISVVATGVGKDGDAALQNAFRNAVSQAVGVLVSAETLVENDAVVKDKILSFSRGFVESYEPLGEPTTEDGLVSVRIRAEVKRTDLRDRLQSAGIIKIAVDGRVLAAQATIREDSHADATEMLVDMLEKFPANLYDISATWRYDPEIRKVVIEVETKIDTRKYAIFRREFTEMLPKVGGQMIGTAPARLSRSDENIRNIGLVPVISISRIPTNNPRLHSHKMPGHHFFIADTWPNFRRAGQTDTVNFRVYTVPFGIFGMTRPMFEPRNMVVRVVDGNGDVLATARAKAPVPGFSAETMIGGYLYIPGPNSHNVVVLFPSLFAGNHGVYDFLPGTPEYKQQVPFDLSREQMERITAVHISME